MMNYCIDTSTMIDAGERFYPVDVFPAFWARMNDLVEAGRLSAPPTLIEELERKSDEWRDWVYSRCELMIRPLDAAVLSLVSEVLSAYAKERVNEKNITGDPFFIAYAKAHDLTLITSEAHRKGGARIPSICALSGVRSTTLLRFLRDEGWQF